MTPKQIDRLLTVLERAVAIAQRWVDAEYPIHDETEAEFYRQGESREADSPEEYEALPQEEGRFSKIFKAAHPET